MELVTGATGYVGSRLLRRLVGGGPAGARARAPPERVERLPGRGGACAATCSRGRARGGARGLRDRLLPRALDGGRRRQRRLRRPRPARGHHLRRGRGRAPAWSGSSTSAASPRPGPLSPHLRSRLEVEEILLGAVPGSTALRASIVIGAGSSSFRVLVRLVERLRLLPMPRWRSNRTQPIDERDVIEFLARTPAVPAAAGRSLDICGPGRAHLRGA